MDEVSERKSCKTKLFISKYKGEFFYKATKIN